MTTRSCDAGDAGAERVQAGRLAAEPVPPEISMLRPDCTPHSRKRGRLSRQSAEPDQVLEGAGAQEELADRDVCPARRRAAARRRSGVSRRPVGRRPSGLSRPGGGRAGRWRAGRDAGARRRPRRARRSSRLPLASMAKTRCGPLTMISSTARIVQQRLQRAEAEDVVEDAARQSGRIG